MSYSKKVKELADLVKGCRRVYALTGAGISTESGIPDFRSPGTGLWEKMDPMKVLSLTAFRRDPAAFYENFLDFWKTFTGVRPNAGHIALARMEEMGYLQGVITQNIDNLHQMAGSKRVWEVHGHLRTGYCMKCNSSYPFADIMKSVEQGENPPLCEKCKGIVRPSVVLFEDLMSPDFFECRTELKGADLLIVAGSSLRVQPAASLPSLANKVAIINKQPTPWDSKAAVVINDSISKTLSDLIKYLEE